MNSWTLKSTCVFALTLLMACGPEDPPIVQVIGDAVVKTDVPMGKCTESGGSARVEVFLTRAPSAAVTVRASLTQPDPRGPAQATLSPQELVFSPDTWQTPQEFVVTGLDDMQHDGTQVVTLTFEPVASDDPGFAGQLIPPVDIEVRDGACGNGLEEEGEACDTGPDFPQECPYGEATCQVCTSECTLTAGTPGARCGDGIVQPEEEACDQGPAPSLDCAYGEASCTVCNAECQEQPGNRVGDCGDGNVQVDQGEECDPGPAPNFACAYGETSCMVCQNDCSFGAGTTSFCGDGVEQTDQGEACDEGTDPRPTAPTARSPARSVAPIASSPTASSPASAVMASSKPMRVRSAITPARPRPTAPTVRPPAWSAARVAC